tara:strand:- start:916 stop:1413 length:498 start_codon:yes stop_codon:yes gene_type:complete
MMDKIDGGKLVNQVQIKELTFHLRPLTYKETTHFSQQHFTLQKQIAQVENLNIEESEKAIKRQEILDTLSQVNIDLSIAHISNITKGEDNETDVNAIKSFVIDNDAEIFGQVRNGIEEMNVDWNNDILDITCASEDCDSVYKSKLNVDYSSFFGTRSLRSRNLNF